jgi:beta propeller repeat protein
VPQSYPDGLAVEGKTIVYTGRNFPDGNDDPDICISTDAGANFKRYRLPVHQVNAKINGNIVVFDDSRYGLMRESVHYLDIDTGEFHQIGDETKGIYYYPDISGSNVVYIFDPDFDSYLKDQYNVNQEVHLTDISTDKTSVIASPNAQITSLAIDKDYIVWCDNRNKSNYKLYLYNLKENKEYSVADIIDKNGADTHISKNTIVWADDLDNKRVVKIVTIRDDETITDNGGNSGTDDTDNAGNSDSTQPQNADSQTASGEIVCIIISVGIALIVMGGYHGRKNN